MTSQRFKYWCCCRRRCVYINLRPAWNDDVQRQPQWRGERHDRITGGTKWRVNVKSAHISMYSKLPTKFLQGPWSPAVNQQRIQDFTGGGCRGPLWGKVYPSFPSLLPFPSYVSLLSYPTPLPSFHSPVVWGRAPVMRSGVNTPWNFCIGLSRYIAITTFSIIAVIAAFCRISPSILNRFKPNLQT